mmetsp:Transcript_104162/g.291815  ORF Transcript_104162/g.291815 Transcript_104162/m.291815 type:complete len:101 (+) Transcript_104162:78-380(+)
MGCSKWARHWRATSQAPQLHLNSTTRCVMASPLCATRCGSDNLAANSIDAAEESLEDIVGTAMVDLVRVKVLVEDPCSLSDTVASATPGVPAHAASPAMG